MLANAPRQSASKRRPAFTLVEMLIVVAVLGSITAFAMPKVNHTIRQRRVIAAASALASDIEAAYSLAARQRKPVRVSYDASSAEVRIADRSSGTVHRRRPLGMSSEYHVDAVTMLPSTVDLFPGGVSSAAFSIRLTNGDFRREVQVTRTGLTRVIVP